MATASTDSLISQAKCIDQCIPRGMQMAVLIAVFAKLAGMSTTDTNALINLAKCVDQCIPPGMQLAVLNGLASQIASGGGGLAQIFCGTGTPIDGSANPNPGSPIATCAIWIQSDSAPVANMTTAIWINGSWQ